MRAVADTSVLLRLLLPDEPALVAAVEQYLTERETRTLFVAPTTVSEVTYVLRGPRLALGRERTIAAIRLLRELPLRFLDGDIIDRALAFYEHARGDWDDCMVAAYATERADSHVLAYDRDFDRIPGLSRIEPPMVTS